ncbi:MAG: SurA N-terminal domain-containing protein [Verrucomicrobia bacterium]|nr:SurA N-terminal domain-containing protein [Verrucomicrobiota bacterium]
MKSLLRPVLLVIPMLALQAWTDTNTNATTDASASAPSEKVDVVKAVPAGIPSSIADTSTVAVVNGAPIPYEWFLHEFRSTFFRYNDAPDSRNQVLDSLIERSLLHAAAVKEGILDDLETVKDINERVSSMRAFMEYRLEMARLSMVIDKFLETKHLSPDDFEATEDDLADFFMKEVKGKPGAPESVEEIPEHIKSQLMMRIKQSKQMDAVQALVAGLRKEADVQVNQSAVDSVPMPDMKGLPGGSISR